jgi:hypothetical protein
MYSGTPCWKGGYDMSEISAAPATVKTKVSMSMQVKRAADGSVEDYGEQFSKVVELDYENAVRLMGHEKADELFKGVERSEDGN